MMPAGLVLAGGGARRMGGGDKPLLRLGTRTILQHVLDRLAGQAHPICLSANGDARRFARYGLPVLPDTLPGAGPLLGVAAGLAWAAALGADTLLVVPADTPFLPPDLAARLAPAPAVAEAGGRVHNLVCLLPVMTLPALAAWLARGHTRAGSFLTEIAARPVAFDDAAAFLNINTPDDLDAARRRLDPVSP